MKNQIHSLTGLRAFAAGLVLSLHYNQAFGAVNFGEIFPVISVGYLGVDIFFVLSGYILTYVYGVKFRLFSMQESLHFIKLRIARIYPVHLAGLAFIFSLYWAAMFAGYGFSSPENWVHSDLFFHATMTHAWFMDTMALWNTPSWSISAEFFAYLCLPLGLPLLLTKIRAALCLVLTALVILIVYGFFGVDLGASFKGWSAILRVSTEFWMGAATYILTRDVVPQKIYRVVTYLALGLFAVSSYLYAPDWLLIFLAPFLIFSLHKGSDPFFSGRVPVYIGKISYSIYIMHFPVQLLLMQVYSRTGVNTMGILLQLVWYLFAMGVAVCVGAMTYHFIEDPARRWIRNHSFTFGMLRGMKFVTPGGVRRTEHR